MTNPDHVAGGLWTACILMLVAAAVCLGISTFASVQIAQLFAFPSGAGVANAIARMYVVLGGVCVAGGTTLFLIAASAQARWFFTALSGFTVFVACLVILVGYASPTMYNGWGWHLLTGMFAGAMVADFAAKRADRLAPGPMFRNPIDD